MSCRLHVYADWFVKPAQKLASTGAKLLQPCMAPFSSLATVSTSALEALALKGLLGW